MKCELERVERERKSVTRILRDYLNMTGNKESKELGYGGKAGSAKIARFQSWYSVR